MPNSFSECTCTQIDLFCFVRILLSGVSFCILYFIHVFYLSLVAELQKMVFALKLNLLFHLTDGAEHHASRVLQSRENLPSILWLIRTTVLHDQ
jgi:hypothetical protein